MLVLLFELGVFSLVLSVALVVFWCVGAALYYLGLGVLWLCHRLSSYRRIRATDYRVIQRLEHELLTGPYQHKDCVRCLKDTQAAAMVAMRERTALMEARRDQIEAGWRKKMEDRTVRVTYDQGSHPWEKVERNRAIEMGNVYTGSRGGPPPEEASTETAPGPRPEWAWMNGQERIRWAALGLPNHQSRPREDDE